MSKQTIKTDKELTHIPMIHKGRKSPKLMPVQQAQELLISKNSGGWKIDKESKITWTLENGFKQPANKE